MKQTLFFAIALAVLLSGCSFFKGLAPVTPADPGPAVDIVARALENTIALQTKDEGRTFCSGVAAEGVFITAAHCVGKVDFDVLYRGKSYPGVITLVWEERDLAFIDAIGARMQDTPGMTEWEPIVGQKIVWTGYPAGIELLMGTGIVAAPKTVAFGLVGFTAIYGMFTPGNSGGPVWDETGKLFGIVSSGLVYGSHPQTVGYVVSPESLKEALKAL